MATAMTDRISVAANSTSANVLAGKLYEFAPAAGMIELLVVAAAVGIFTTFVVGTQIVIDDQEVSGAGGFPKASDDVLTVTPVLLNERLVLRHRNSTIAAIFVVSKVGYVEA